ncbi:phage tail sheath C-terminal domain-containing protein [Variovorax sp. KK3]|uniref:phage tail sheath family protein n=1 Tax=Variovorax sp. KK3 TaxID=1855728 RepID=UPI00097BB45D|nr:phage tail sheath C-terminal domain-containing protein [Variovorax sp. KK3]
MPTYRTPDVYVEEISVFPPSVAEVETAIPAFIGYTAQARKVSIGDLAGRPTKIYNFAEYEQYFGGPDTPDIGVALVAEGPGFISTVTPPTVTYLLYHAVKMFFDNGGGKCYIVSVGTYVDAIAIAALTAGLDAVALEDEPTLLVCPEVVRLAANGYDTMSQNMLIQCGTLKDRFAILDLFGGDAAQDNAALTANRARVGNNHLKYGALYYPFLKSSFNHAVAGEGTNVNVTIDGAAAVTLDTLQTTATAAFNAAKAALLDHFIVLPPSGAVAGVYAATDTARGVWKAPANVGLADVVEPVVRLDTAHQDELNVDATTGKSVNAIRAFAGKGTLVWGARTLAGNDNEWRYVSVRRFFNMVEESVKKSTYWAVFEPNDANTWVKVRGMIENYLTQKWREGALAGATTKDAFYVRCGLGTTMSPQDILEGRMNVEIAIATVRPAEFIILKFSHKLQTS